MDIINVALDVKSVDVRDGADDICVDRKWYFEKVVYYMTAESEKL